MDALQARLRDEILSVLTPEQKAEVQKVEAERAQRLAQRQQNQERRPRGQ
jgi:Spy/CpxP family protein refolding chaperone